MYAALGFYSFVAVALFRCRLVDQVEFSIVHTGQYRTFQDPFALLPVMLFKEHQQLSLCVLFALHHVCASSAAMKGCSPKTP